MKKIIIVLALILVCLIYQKHSKPTQIIYLDNKTLSQPLASVQQHPVIIAINNINRNNSMINTVQLSINLRLHKKIIYNLNGNLFYQKDKNIRVSIKNRFGTLETDIGSNDQYYWFWSRRMNPPDLYYGTQEGIAKSRLKTPFHPMWMIETLGVGKIDTANARVVKKDNFWAILEPRISTQGEVITKVTVIDPEHSRIMGHYILNSLGTLIVSTEVIAFYNINGQYLPKNLNTIWHEENIALEWEFSNPIINQGIAPSMWAMPYHKNMKNINR